jgi:flavodoxin I
MKILVLYDSFFGNTEQIAQEIGSAFSEDDVQVRHASSIGPGDFADVKLLFVGSPTRNFRATNAIEKLPAPIPAKGLKGVKAAAFDTRVDIKAPHHGLLAVLTLLYGYAGGRITRQLQKKGATLAGPAEGFIVEGTEGEGPLKEGELERTASWARKIKAENSNHRQHA